MVEQGSDEMDMEKAAPCRHAGAPPESVVKLTVNAIRSVASDREFLARNGLTEAEFTSALPTAIQKIRGSAAASNSERREFLLSMFDSLRATGIIDGYIRPDYGDDTVYELDVTGIGKVAIVQKGCPDGIHSSVKWSRPEWADEAYLWWLCDSLSYEPGEHVAKGVNRLRNRFFDEGYRDSIDGVIFHNSLCGTPIRPCPKMAKAIRVGDVDVPPPCIWVMPERVRQEGDEAMEWNSRLGVSRRAFVAVRHNRGQLRRLRWQRGLQTATSTYSDDDRVEVRRRPNDALQE